MVKIIERIRAHYEMPFGKTYEWHPAYVVLECGCGKRWTLDAKSTITTCQCGCDLANILTRGIQDGEATLPEEVSRPWFYDAKERAQQHQRDEEAYPEGSP
jgi:hypothetical protein